MARWGQKSEKAEAISLGHEQGEARAGVAVTRGVVGLDLGGGRGRGHARTFGDLPRSEGEPPRGCTSLDSIVPPGPWATAAACSPLARLARSRGDRQTFLLVWLRDRHRAWTVAPGSRVGPVWGVGLRRVDCHGYPGMRRVTARG